MLLGDELDGELGCGGPPPEGWDDGICCCGEPLDGDVGNGMFGKVEGVLAMQPVRRPMMEITTANAVLDSLCLCNGDGRRAPALPQRVLRVFWVMSIALLINVTTVRILTL